MKKSIQKGLHSRVIVPEISADHPMFANFLSYLLNIQGYTSEGLIKVVADPHNYTQLWEEYYDETNE